jgi:hypothetical protein
MVKRTDTSGNNWAVYDTARDTFNASGLFLGPNTSVAEADDRPILDFLSNGFKIRTTAGTLNASGGTYIVAAFAEVPTKFANAR